MWFYFAIFTSITSGFSIILSKKTLNNVSPIVLYWATLAVATPVLFVSAFIHAIPRVNKYFFIGVFFSILLYTFSKILIYHSIRGAHLSHVYPLIALGPIVTLFAASFPPLSEQLTSLGLLGAAISIIGSYVLNISAMREGIWEPFKILLRNRLALLMLFAVIISGFVPIFDKFAINNTEPRSSLFTVFVANILSVVIMLPYVFKNRKIFIKEISTNKIPLFVLGILFGVSSIFAFLALGSGNVGIVSAVFRSQVLFTLLFSFLFLKDRPRAETIIGTIIMILGLVILKMVP